MQISVTLILSLIMAMIFLYIFFKIKSNFARKMISEKNNYETNK